MPRLHIFLRTICFAFLVQTVLSGLFPDPHAMSFTRKYALGTSQVLRGRIYQPIRNTVAFARKSVEKATRRASPNSMGSIFKRFIQPEITKGVTLNVHDRVSNMLNCVSNNFSIMVPLVQFAQRLIFMKLLPAIITEVVRYASFGVLLYLFLNSKLPLFLLRRISVPSSRDQPETSNMLSMKAENSTIRFSDVVGVDEAKSELEDIIAYLRNSTRFLEMGATLPKGVLLTGEQTNNNYDNY